LHSREHDENATAHSKLMKIASGLRAHVPR
jgi:hypothetical protein